MLVFQIIFTPITGTLTLLTLWAFLRRRGLWLAMYALLWGCATFFILVPNTTNALAHALGIQRGGDLVTYILLLFFFWCHFQHYLRYKRQEEQITMLVRELAISRPVSVPNPDGMSDTASPEDGGTM